MPHPEFQPIRSLAEMALLNEDEVHAGYLAGYGGAPEPTHPCYSRAYWHGWRNGHVDAGFAEPDLAQRLLAHEYNSTIGEYRRPAIL